MRKILLPFLFILGFNCYAHSQSISGCENVTAFNKNSTPDLGIVISSGDEETVWNAIRLATLSQSKGDSVVIFVIGKGMDVYMKDSSKFNIRDLSLKFLINGGDIYTCATCAKLRNTENVNSCIITSISDLYEIVSRSKKVLTF